MRSLGVEVLRKLLFQRQSGRETVRGRGMIKYIKLAEIISKDCGTQELTRIHQGRIDKTDSKLICIEMNLGKNISIGIRSKESSVVRAQSSGDAVLKMHSWIPFTNLQTHTSFSIPTWVLGMNWDMK